MNYRNPQLLDELAAQYAVGTLRGAARVRFEKLCRQQPTALTALHRWEDRLVGLVSQVESVQPPATVWSKVQQRLGLARDEASTEPGFFSRLFGWLSRTQLALAAGVAAIALTFAIVSLVTTSERAQVLAIIANEQQTEQWLVKATEGSAKLIISRSANLALDANRDYELWALLDSGAAPVSLGLMPKNGKRELQLTVAQRTALAGSGKIAVSLEPIGGSPTGAPTGPVLFVANVVRA